MEGVVIAEAVSLLAAPILESRMLADGAGSGVIISSSTSSLSSLCGFCFFEGVLGWLMVLFAGERVLGFLDPIASRYCFNA